ncbi:YbbR-like protein [Tenacibaculum sp. MAR_2009_124]|uniref:CdaR family protein n=1 Tax=Tenacibaculum sp. MAR_2009_124 TaxID=1250059 RepID=UPI000896FD79|nr:YbbR-like domain-containing protein [Tenacibaculum sp. MAR_2009_124]SEB83432.1 YbbR-like protein [Tenacibaculum sp. MAR_2009_124]
MSKAITIPKAFLGFLIASLLFWLLMNLSKEYVTDISLDVSYQNIEQDKLILNEPPKEISLSVKASGFKLMGTSFVHKPIIIDLKNLARKTDSTYYLLSKNLMPEIQNQLKSGLTLNKVKADTIFFSINKLYSKKVAIEPNININYKKGFDLASAITLVPDSIVISGAQTLLNTIEKVKTKEIELSNVSNNVNTKIEILIPNKIKAKYKKASLEFKVDKFTEGKMEIPVSITNLPKDKSVSVYPKTVTIIYKVGLKNFNKIDSNFFEVYCDYNESLKNKLPYLVPKLKSKANIASSVRIVPNKIDFLIHK